MSTNVGYWKRNFILSKEDQGFGTNSDPLCYAKVEVRNDRVIASISVKNLRKLKTSYDFILVRCDDEYPYYIQIGKFETDHLGKLEFTWTLDLNKIQDDITKCNVAAIVTGLPVNNISENEASRDALSSNNHDIEVNIKAPLVAYNGKKVDWRKVLVNGGKKVEKTKAFTTWSLGEKNINESERRVNEYIQRKSDQLESAVPVGDEKKMQITEEKVQDTQLQWLPAESAHMCQPKGLDYSPTTLCQPQTIQPSYLQNCEQQDHKTNTCMQQCYEVQSPKVEDIDNLFEKHLKQCVPFHNPTTGYSWWKAEDIQHIYMLFSKLRLPVTYIVMMQFHTYKHIICGTYVDEKNTKYTIVGIPGLYGIEPNAFNPSMSLWVSTENYLPECGRFGYWLIYIDSKTGQFLTL